jgi:glutathione S-transferase
MDDTLSTQDFLTGNTLTLADICLFPYTHVAEEGGVYDLLNYPHVQRWINTIKALNWYLPISHATL